MKSFKGNYILRLSEDLEKAQNLEKKTELLVII